MGKDAITLSTRLTRADVAGLVEALVEGLKEGSLRVQKSDACLTLDVPRVVDLEIRAGQEAERTVFRVDVSWRTEKPDIPDVDMPDDCPPGAPSAASAKKKAAKPRPGAKNRTPGTKSV